MRHVREEVPDVQLLRPERLCGHRRRCSTGPSPRTSRHRYPDAASMVADLEEVLALEASRSGQATGEVTTCCAPCPEQPAGGVPWRMRHPARWAASLALVGASSLSRSSLLPGRRTAARAWRRMSSRSAGLQPVPLSQTAAHDYNPFGTGPENRNLIQNVVDSDPNTTWSTEQYYDGTLKKPGGVGAGLYLDASPGVAGRAIEIQTPTPGFAVQIYVADHIEISLPYGDPTPLAARGWQGPVGASGYVHDRERIQLSSPASRFATTYLDHHAAPQHAVGPDRRNDAVQ